MQKILYKDVPFWVEVEIHPRYEFLGSSIRVYSRSEHTSFWLKSKFFKYKLLASIDDKSRQYIQSDAALMKVLEEAYCTSEERPTRCIECSPQIHALYEK